MPIGNTFPIYFSFERDSSDPDIPMPGKMKSFGHLLNHLKNMCGSYHSEKTEYLGQIQRKRNICNRQFQLAFTCEDDSDPPPEGLVRSPPWGT